MGLGFINCLALIVVDSVNLYGTIGKAPEEERNSLGALV